MREGGVSARILQETSCVCWGGYILPGIGGRLALETLSPVGWKGASGFGVVACLATSVVAKLVGFVTGVLNRIGGQAAWWVNYSH